MGNDDAIVGRIFSRRQALRTAMRAGFGLATVGWMQRIAAAGTIPTTQPCLPLIASPAMTEGPFFVDEKLNRSDLVAGTDRPSVVNGVPLMLGFTVYQMTQGRCTPLKGLQVDVWHADAAGAYSDESDAMNHQRTTGEKWLRGFQMTDDAGAVQFKSIFPGWYPGRTPHIHFKVRQFAADGRAKDFTSQVFFREEEVDRIYSQAPYATSRGGRDTRNQTDGIYAERLSDGTMSGDQMLVNLAKDGDGKGYTTLFPLILTEASMQGASSRGRGGRGGPPRGGFGPPPWGY